MLIFIARTRFTVTCNHLKRRMRQFRFWQISWRQSTETERQVIHSGQESELNRASRETRAAGRTNSEYDTLVAVAIRECQVSFSDGKGVRHSVTVQASSVLEAAGLG